MDQLTKQFFSNDFPGFHTPVKIEDQILTTDVPVIELDFSIDFGLLLPIEDCIQLNVPKNVREVYPYEDYRRISGWSLEPLWSDGTVVPAIKDVYYKKFWGAVPFNQAPPLATKIKSMLTTLGFNVTLCWISAFEAGGYVRPHRDILIRPHPLSYFWLPLNYPKGNQLKTYPYGTVDVTAGRMYLLNQENYTHAVMNDSDETRYALLGYFDPNISEPLRKTIQQAITQQYTIA